MMYQVTIQNQNPIKHLSCIMSNHNECGNSFEIGITMRDHAMSHRNSPVSPVSLSTTSVRPTPREGRGPDAWAKCPFGQKEFWMKMPKDLQYRNKN